MPIVDAQVHVWAADSPGRPWPAGRGGDAQKPYPVDAGMVLAAMDAAGVDRAVLVPPSWEGDRNDVALAAAAAHPQRFAVMGRLPLEDADAGVRRLAAWKQEPGMLGARFTFHRREHRAGLHEGRYEWLWQAAAAAQVPLMVFVPGSVPAIDAIAERHPGLRLVIDHLALAVGGPSDAAFAHLPALLRLARLPNVAVKASALPNYSREPYPFRDLHAHVRAVVDAFGPRRVFFGTDWTRLACRYDEPKNGSYPLVLRVDSA